ncbi:MAG: N-acyl amino acid synthase FeeM domain-containing protein [Hyphomicrobiaceae bacterium]
MVSPARASIPSFSERISELMSRVDYRLATDPHDREEIFKLRYLAYRREESIPPNTSQVFSDDYDEKGNVGLYGVYIDGHLASSVRIHIATSSQPICPSLGPFEDVLGAELEADKIVVDSTRFVTDKALSQELTGLPHMALRLCWQAVEFVKADHFLAAVRPEHQAFYRRTFGHRLICPARTYPLLKTPICLMSVGYADAVDDVYRRYPFYRTTAFERRMLIANVLRREPVGPEIPDYLKVINGSNAKMMAASQAS